MYAGDELGRGVSKVSTVVLNLVFIYIKLFIFWHKF